MTQHPPDRCHAVRVAEVADETRASTVINWDADPIEAS